MEKPRFRYALTRIVKEPRRAGENEAGIDFFIPQDLNLNELIEVNFKVIKDVKKPTWYSPNQNQTILKTSYDDKYLVIETDFSQISEMFKFVRKITLGPGASIIIPSGVVGLLEPANSMLMAANKSGISSKKGLIYGAEIVDSTYTGEIHLNIINTTHTYQEIDLDKAILQFIHVPIYNTIPENISYDEFSSMAKDWSNRGSNWQGSTDNQ